MPLTKTSPCSPHSSAANCGACLPRSDALVCDSLLWIGNSDHSQMHAAWQVCRTHCDTVSHRSGLNEATGSPSRRMPTHVIVAQANRHDYENLAIEVPALGKLCSCYPNARLLVLRSPLVAPTARLRQVSSPAASQSGCGWDESAAAPTTEENWRARCQRAGPARHVWITAMANWQQRPMASENGIDRVLEKPRRLERLIEGLPVAPERAPERVPEWVPER